MVIQPPDPNDPVFQAFKRKIGPKGSHLTLVVNRRIRPIEWEPIWRKLGAKPFDEMFKGDDAS